MRVALLACSIFACSRPAPSPGVIANTAPEPPRVRVSDALNIRFKLRGYFYAGAEVSRGLGGNAISKNLPRPVAELEGAPAGAGLQLVALPDQPRRFGKDHDGFRVLVINASATPVQFAAQDSRLEIVHEAIDPDGKWAEIEYLPRSWCGNSYHELELPARSYWELAAPHYDGELATRLRLKLTLRDGDRERHVYSNEWPGRINSEQFTTEQGHQPAGIMDPYDE
jgi:hypothetical protein